MVPLYFSAKCPVVERDGMTIMVADDRLPLYLGEVPQIRRVRFRTLGCYPLTSAIASDAADLNAVIDQLIASRLSERQGRLTDSD